MRGNDIRFRSLTRSALAAAGLVAGLAGAAVLVAPGAAYAASSAGVSGATLRVDAQAGKANQFRLGMLNTTITITDSGDILTAGAGCVSINRNMTECDATSVTRILINTGDGDDTVESQVLLDTTVNAGDGADLVTTSGRADTLNGGPGADVLNAGAGDDTLNGGAGADVLNGGANRDNLDGGTEADVFNGGADQDTADYDSRTVSVTVDLDGVADDGATGELDNVGVDVERILGGSAADKLTGSNLADVPNTLDGNEGSDTLIGLAGQDGLVGNEGDDTMLGGAGFDDFFPGIGRDDMSGGTERDEVFYSERTARVEVRLFDNLPNDGELNEGDNARSDVEDVHTGSGPDLIIGTDNVDNNLTGGTGNDSLIDGKSGDDFLGGDGGNDTLRGGDGEDTLRGGPDQDTLEGGKGKDSLNGDDGDDVVSGGVLGAGNDGADDMQGGFGFDTVSYTDHGGVPVTVSLDGLANDGATGQNEGDNAGFGFEAITGGVGSDVLIGDDNGNLLIGGLAVQDGGDQLIGNNGNDDLRGGFGNDVLNCGAGPSDVGNGNEGTGDSVSPLHGCETLLGVP